MEIELKTILEAALVFINIGIIIGGAGFVKNVRLNAQSLVDIKTDNKTESDALLKKIEQQAVDIEALGAKAESKQAEVNHTISELKTVVGTRDNTIKGLNTQVGGLHERVTQLEANERVLNDTIVKMVTEMQSEKEARQKAEERAEKAEAKAAEAREKEVAATNELNGMARAIQLLNVTTLVMPSAEPVVEKTQIPAPEN